MYRLRYISRRCTANLVSSSVDGMPGVRTARGHVHAASAKHATVPRAGIVGARPSRRVVSLTELLASMHSDYENPDCDLVGEMLVPSMCAAQNVRGSSPPRRRLYIPAGLKWRRARFSYLGDSVGSFLSANGRGIKLEGAEDLSPERILCAR